ncbi:sugar transferase [Flavobacterium sp. KACC 22761]|uniref:sugar transferase n=1 Tax=Flavobacterium sp. KACC 22761 TaxID=3092665 RepID=UPI002A763647|nr:sugar transferase [Flavobacterium sp. KACC 22761]WPO79089.1 sugar transferase [Flavobacterium sp. KACC 22761]
MTELAPVVLFTYKRIDTLKKTVEALKKNKLAIKTDLFVFSDAAKNENDKEAVDNVRSYIRSINGFKTIKIKESLLNKGLACSIIEGVSEVLAHHKKVIVLEDDLVSSANFLNYMNAALEFYNAKKKVFSITGFSIPIKKHSQTGDIYFTLRSSSWGWATWNDRWSDIDWEVKDYNEFKHDKENRKRFSKMGSDMANMLDRQMNGEINSWAIRWCYYQFKNNLFSVHPLVSKVENVGFNSQDASNTKEKYNRYRTILDDGEKTNFKFTNDISLNPKIISQFVKPFSIVTRIKYKLIHFLFKS